ncbi:hypothetical protein VMCG_08112 [Cytospora schulzeri]|uniref:FAD-binding domain-containing protein n=1 Tax=Cytospora schulzeri TaxID=448051 RepID=A0A423VRJ8_9PEZI|nr:hypothetical protein VMCG_08112 [Valsa malicola]
MAKRNFKVIIAGGSVAGLSLANMLEKHGIDYILLEAHGEIAPNIGASLGLFPNGMRILDQLGCFEAVSELKIPPFQGQHILDAEGQNLSVEYGMAEHFERRHGYLGGFVDRQQLIQILYDKLKHKERLLVNKGVEHVDMAESHVTVTTKDGDTFTGDLIVGADGIHSKVRQQMWRVANQIEPATFGGNEEAEVPCYFKCIFGISKPGSMPQDMSNGQVLAKKCTMLIAQGSGRRAYFFLFVPVSPDGPKYGKDIPRYTKEDEARLVEEYWDVPIVKGKLTFGDLYKQRIISTLVPLQEHVYKKWYYGRIMTIGDAAHKQDPIGGQGGNGAIETAAVLTNALVKMLDQYPDHPSTQHIESALAKAQELRHERAILLMNFAHSIQGFLWKMKSPIGERFVRLFMSFMDPVTQSNLFGASVVDGPRLDGIPVPRRPRAIPYTDELPARPVKGNLASWLPAIFTAMLLALVALLRTATSSPFSIATVDRPVSKFADERLSTPATDGLTIGVSAILLPSFHGFDGQYRVAMLAPTLVVWFVESHRLGNRLSPMSLMAVFGALSQLYGVTRVAPFYYILSIFTGSNTIVGRRVRDEVVYTIIPDIMFGQAVLERTLPILCNAMAWSHLKDLSWLLIPAYCKLVHRWIKASWVGKSKEEVKASRGAEALSAYSITDASLLRTTYAATFVVSALIHLGIIGRFVYRSSLNLSLALSTSSLSRDILSHGLLLTIYLLYTAWDLRRLGYITNMEVAKAVAAVAVGQLLVGPGATYIGMWYWREGILTRLHVGFEEMTERKTGAKS